MVEAFRAIIPAGPTTKQQALPKRFFASVELNADRLGRDAGRIAEEVVQHLSTLRGAKLAIILDIQADAAEGFADEVEGS